MATKDNKTTNDIKTERSFIEIIQDIDYRLTHLESDSDNFTKNPFDNKIIIVDEAHNLVSRIVNKIKNKESLSYRIYDYLMSAQNCKIVLLTGTPIINYPNEIGILFNIPVTCS